MSTKNDFSASIAKVDAILADLVKSRNEIIISFAPICDTTNNTFDDAIYGALAEMTNSIATLGELRTLLLFAQADKEINHLEETSSEVTQDSLI